MQKAPLGKRFVALLIDSVLIGAATALVSLLLSGYYYVVSFLIAMIYSSLTEGSEAHATLGKQLMKLKVADRNGNGADKSQAAIRNAVKYGPALLGIFLPEYIPGIFGIINYCVGAFGADRQAIHDMTAATYVIAADVAAAPFPVSPPPQHSVFICGVSGVFSGARFQVTSPVVFGRDKAVCNLVFPSDTPGVSGRHCELSIRDGYVFLTDLDSSYGTFVSGKRLENGRPAMLRNTDRFTVGSNTFSVDIV